ncbi:MAG: hypothetical protein IKM66_04150 [Clostridia bacterium]|nr:hypothetical protein [Clostridia bacterium]
MNFLGNNNCSWIIVLIIIILFCNNDCGYGNSSCGYNSSCGCNNGCGCCG